MPTTYRGIEALRSALSASTASASSGQLPQNVSPSKMEKILDVGHTKGAELIRTRQVESFKIGKARKITVASIEAYIARQIAASNPAPPATPISGVDHPLGHGRVRRGG